MTFDVGDDATRKSHRQRRNIQKLSVFVAWKATVWIIFPTSMTMDTKAKRKEMKFQALRFQEVYLADNALNV